MASARVILVDDHEMLRAGLKSLIEKEVGFQVVGQAADQGVQGEGGEGGHAVLPMRAVSAPVVATRKRSGRSLWRLAMAAAMAAFTSSGT